MESAEPRSGRWKRKTISELRAARARIGKQRRVSSAEGDGTGIVSAGRGDVGESSAGRGDVGESSAGRGDEGESSAGRGDVGELSAGGGDVGESSAGRGDMGESSAGRGDVGESSAGRGDVGEFSSGRGDVAESSGGLAEQEGTSGGYGLSDIEDESALSSDDEGRFDDDKAQGCFDDWMISLPSQDRKMLAVSLYQTFMKRQKMNATDAAGEAASFVGFNERTVRKYNDDFFTNHGQFPETKRGKYTRQCLLSNETLRLEAAMWVRENAYQKGAANMTAASFCQWVNETLLVQHNLDANLPRRISVRTATRWLHHLGLRPQSHKKGAYVDGHEREDVIKSRREFLQQIRHLKDTHLPPPPCSDERAVTLPADAENRKKLVLIYHDESIFNINEGQPWMWATEDTPIIQPKTKGSGVMVSDFVEQHRGFLQLSDEEHANISAEEPEFPKSARVLFEYGAEKEGYWTGDKFMNNIKNAVKIAEHIYTPATHTIIWLFDQSSCHKAFAEDSLNVRRMNVFPGGAQSRMHDTMWGRRVQKMVMEDGRPKGMKMVLEERGINTRRMNADDMRVVLSNHEDFRTEKTIIEHHLVNRGHLVYFIPKFHCELNPIERVWGQAKVYTRMHTNFTLVRLRQIVGPALDSVQADLIRKYFRRVDEYERAYLEGKKAGKELEQAVKVYKSHRRIFFD